MKTNEVPEKVYVHVKHGKALDSWNSVWIGVNDIEYTRTDAFIEKACDAYCAICDTKECDDTGECLWVKKFRKRLMK